MGSRPRPGRGLLLRRRGGGGRGSNHATGSPRRRLNVSYTPHVAIGPAPVLALLIGGFHTALFVFLRARAGVRIALVFAAAALGAWAGDALGGRTGVDPIRIGDFHVLSASLVAWAGITFVAVLSILGPVERRLRP